MAQIPFSADVAATSVFWNMNFGPPSAAQQTTLLNFLAPQYAYGQQIGVMDPGVYAYEALGAALATSSPHFQNLWGPLAAIDTGGGVIVSPPPRYAATVAGDAGFVTDAYASVFGQAATSAQAQHFVEQLDYLKGLYTAAHLYGDAEHVDLVARGAVYGQMIGIHNEMVPFVGVPELPVPGLT